MDMGIYKRWNYVPLYLRAFIGAINVPTSVHAELRLANKGYSVTQLESKIIYL